VTPTIQKVGGEPMTVRRAAVRLEASRRTLNSIDSENLPEFEKYMTDAVRAIQAAERVLVDFILERKKNR